VLLRSVLGLFVLSLWSWAFRLGSAPPQFGSCTPRPGGRRALSPPVPAQSGLQTALPSHLGPLIWDLPFGASHLEPLTDFGKMGSFSWKIPLSLNKSASYIFLGFNTGTLHAVPKKTEALSTNSTSFHLCRPATQHNRAVPPSPGLAPVSSGLSSIPAHGREPPTGESTRESMGALPGGSPRGILLESLRRALATLNPLPPERPCISPHASSGKMRP
jgi:hypothetical protein